MTGQTEVVGGQSAGRRANDAGERVMTVERAQPGPSDRDRQNRFETVVRGYDKHQVDDHIARLQQQLAAARTQLADARRDLTVARDDTAALRQQLRPRPWHEQVSDRMTEILRLAQEEAERERNQAAQLAADVLARAQAEAGEVVTEARANAAELRRDTRRSCEDQLANARATASELIETTREEAETTLARARERSQRALADTDKRSRQIMALQHGRLEGVLAAYQDTLHRLEEAERLIKESLDEDREQGDPAAQVDPEVLPTLGSALDTDQHAPPGSRHATASAPT